MRSEKTETTTTKNGICVKCRAELPHGNFLIDAANNQTAWCNVCRLAAAEKWGVDADLVELTYGLYLVEQRTKAEIRLIVSTQVNEGQEPGQASKNLEIAIRHQDSVKHHRVSTFLNEVLTLYRLDYFNAVGVTPVESLAPVVEA